MCRRKSTVAEQTEAKIRKDEVRAIKEERYHIALDDYEHGVVIRALNDTKTELMNEGKSTDAVDDLIIKVGYAPKKKFKVVERKDCSCRESR